MLSAYGTTLTDLQTTLIQLAPWPHEPGDASVTRSDRENVLRYLRATAPWAGNENAATRSKAALDLLTSTEIAFQAIEWKPWQVRRRHREIPGATAHFFPDEGHLSILARFDEAVRSLDL